MGAADITGRFGRLLRGLARTRDGVLGRLRRLGGSGPEIDEERLKEVEEILVAADCGVGVASAVVASLRGRAAEGTLGLVEMLRAELLSCFPSPRPPVASRPQVVFLVGVNGSGKTTTAGKLAVRARAQGLRVLLVAADTWRAAAIEQLERWGESAGVPVIRHREGADPAAVVVDALRAAVARDVDLVVVDTAGRLHTKEPLMREMGKIGRVAGREIPGAPHEVLLVLDAGTGQNGLAQGRTFTEALPLTGLVLTKLDGTARGGVALAMGRELGVPIHYVGVGEEPEDLLDFSPQDFVDGLLAAGDRIGTADASHR